MSAAELEQDAALCTAYARKLFSLGAIERAEQYFAKAQCLWLQWSELVKEGH